MNPLLRIAALLVLGLTTLSALAVRVGPEVPVTDTPGAQRNVVISRDQSRTLIAFEETAGEGQLSRVILHQYEARLGVLLGRETFTVAPSPRHQRRPVLSGNMVGWIEEDPATGVSSVWWQGLSDFMLGSNFSPQGTAEGVGDVAPGTEISIAKDGAFYAILWTAPEERLKGVYRVLLIRIGYDRSVFDVTTTAAFRPTGATVWGSNPVLVAYNRGATPGSPIDLTVLYAMKPQKSIEIAPAGASEPKIVFNGNDQVVFWSMEQGGTFAQRVSAAGPMPIRLGGVEEIAGGVLHEATVAPNGEYFVVVGRGTHFNLLRLDRDLNVLEKAPFEARLAEGSKISISGDTWLTPMIAYATGESRAVFRAIEEGTAPTRRRAVR